jgi:hypothetical protein
MTGGSGGIALDAVSSTTSSGVNTFNWNHTVSGSNRLLLVGISISSTTNVNTVTYNGTPLTRLGFQNNSVRMEIWRLYPPDVGTHAIAVNMAAAASVVAGAVSFTGVDQTTPFDGVAPVFNTSNAGTVSVSITPATNNAWVFDTMASNQIGGNPVPTGTGQTLRWRNINAVTGAGSTTGPISPAALTTMNWTVTGNAPRRSAIGAVALRPVSVGGGASVDWRDIVQ